MSFTTRCPACGTTFKIVPDQLKISDGWVRCGHCADVFDATLFLEGELPSPAPAPALPQAGGWEVEQAPPPAPVPAAPGKVVIPGPARALAEEGDGDWLLRPRVRTVAPPPTPASPPPAKDEAFAEALKQFAAQGTDSGTVHPAPSVPDAASIAVASEPIAQGAEPEPATPPVSRPAPLDEPDAPKAARPGPGLEDGLPVLSEEPSFVRQARRKAFWDSRGMRWSLVLVSLLLLLGLLMQWAVHDRNALAARHPAVHGLLHALCQPVGCTIGPVHRIESVSIDSSNLVRRLGNFYSFDLVLKNNAPMPVAVPALELSLTDTRDNVIARRVFLPEELPGAPEVLPAQGQVSMSLRLSIADSGVSTMTGYQALVFYP
jgi:predicted Zn finger-like uncharacterized protein